ncbi:MAG: nuclear transport factor 2 family protein [Proteobacteria bacterium]|nr:nuclear transport factor 2 family protein [Pseudomonadota bacterium]
MTRCCSIAALLFMASSACYASDTDDLTAMLHQFLAGVSEAAVHDRFWGEDLIYTSSRGTRSSKAEIMQGLAASEDGDSDVAGPVYTAEDIQIQVYGSTAVVAFRLVATPADKMDASGSDTVVQYYFNTGTFVKRNGVWEVVAWQATVIPQT